MPKRLVPLLLLLLSSCRATPPDTGLDYSGLAIVRHAGQQWLCAFQNQDFEAQPGYRVVWRITLAPLDPSFLQKWYGDQTYIGKIRVAGTAQGHMVMEFGDWRIDMLPTDATVRQQIQLEGKGHSGESGIQTVVITGGLDQFVVVGKEPI